MTRIRSREALKPGRFSTAGSTHLIHLRPMKMELGRGAEIDPSSTYKIVGDDNVLCLRDNAKAGILGMEIRGSGNRIEFGESTNFLNLRIRVFSSGRAITIGAHTTIQDAFLFIQEESDITIGRNCMLSRGIEIRTTDAHSVVDVATLRRMNKAGSVRIGDHVWIAAKVLISKGVTVADDCIIGAGALVLRSVSESQCAVAGVPARVVRRGVTWHHARKDSFTREEIEEWKR